jgi:aminomethyltransferase
MPVSPLHQHHARAGAKFFNWSGWLLSGHYSSPEDELDRVRSSVGYTDLPFLSHMVVRGPDACATLQRLITRDLKACPPGKAKYMLALNEDGAVVDDGLLFRLADDYFIVSVACRNPALQVGQPGFLDLKRPKDWLQPEAGARVSIQELGAFHIGVQGPRSRDLLRPAINLDDLVFFAVREAHFADIPVIVSRTGYSGELGFEFLVWPEDAPALWETIVELGKAYDAVPYGMSATLLMGVEKGYLMGHDFFPGSTPIEVGLEWAMDFAKENFVGKQAVLRRREEGIKARLVGLEMSVDSPLPTAGDSVRLDGRNVGKITIAVVSRRLNRILARACVESNIGSSTEVEVSPLSGAPPLKARLCDSFCWYDPRGLRLKL